MLIISSDPTRRVVSTGGYPNILPNPDVTWETSDQLNIGFDARFLKNKLSAEFDWYKRTTYDWLVNPSMLASYGTGAPYVNGGDVLNTGVELALNYNNNAGDVTYSVGINGAYNKNEVKRIANNEGIFHGPGNVLGQGTEELYRAQVGYPIGYFWGYKTLGVFQTEAEVNAYRNPEGNVIQPTSVAGDLIFDDTNDDGVINYLDKVMIGDPNPDFIAGLNFSVGYKGFDLVSYVERSIRSADCHEAGAAGPTHQKVTILPTSLTDGMELAHRTSIRDLFTVLPNNWQYNSDIFIEDAKLYEDQQRHTRL